MNRLPFLGQGSKVREAGGSFTSPEHDGKMRGSAVELFARGAKGAGLLEDGLPRRQSAACIFQAMRSTGQRRCPNDGREVRTFPIRAFPYKPKLWLLRRSSDGLLCRAYRCSSRSEPCRAPSSGRNSRRRVPGPARSCRCVWPCSN